MGEPLSVAVIGAGVSGMAMGLALQRTGREFTIFEKADEVGGTWRENRYPGLTIDVPSPIYTFAGHRHPGWTRWMPGWKEILDYHRDVSINSNLREHIRFNAEVVSATWTGSAWAIVLADGETHLAGALVCASGFLQHPRFPDIAGLDTFAGELVHSAQWRDEIRIEGQRVGVIGTGSTGVQLVSALAGVAGHLTLFQRTAQWVFPGPNFTMPHPVRRLLGTSPRLVENVVEGVGRIADTVLGGAAINDGVRRKAFDLVARAHLRTVRDPELRAKLTPTEAPLCRRPVLSSRFYRAVQHRDVAVHTEDVVEVVPAGVVTADGDLHPLDVLILATGFHAHDYMRPIAITGVDGIDLDAAWKDGPHGYNSVALPGFPNLFMVMGPHSPLVSISIHGSAELQSAYILALLDVIEDRDLIGVMPSEAATERWLDLIRAGMPKTVWATGCSSWYVGTGATPVLWPYDRALWHQVLATPDLRDFELLGATRLDKLDDRAALGG